MKLHHKGPFHCLLPVSQYDSHSFAVDATFMSPDQFTTFHNIRRWKEILHDLIENLSNLMRSYFGCEVLLHPAIY